VLFRISVSYPVAGSSVAAGLGFVAVVLIVIRMINQPGGTDSSLEIGAWIGLIAAAGVAVGSYLGMQDAAAGRAASPG
jgi:hypothetical protein